MLQLYLTKRRIEFNWREGKLKPEKVLRGHDEHVVSLRTTMSPGR